MDNEEEREARRRPCTGTSRVRGESGAAMARMWDGVRADEREGSDETSMYEGSTGPLGT